VSFFFTFIDVRAGWTQENNARGVVAATQYRVGEIKVNAAKAFPNDLIKQVLGLVSGQVFDESQLRKNMDSIRAAYGRLGFINFKVMPVLDFDEQRKTVNVTMNVDEGSAFYVNRITFTGNTRTPDEVIRREIPFREGVLFDSTRLEMARSRLNQLGLFEDIKVEDVLILPSTSEPRVDITFRVREKER
jgi:outer membrane protein insertion porin family